MNLTLKQKEYIAIIAVLAIVVLISPLGIWLLKSIVTLLGIAVLVLIFAVAAYLANQKYRWTTKF